MHVQMNMNEYTYICINVYVCMYVQNVCVQNELWKVFDGKGSFDCSVRV